jgi:hypothetical protein
MKTHITYFTVRLALFTILIYCGACDRKQKANTNVKDREFINGLGYPGGLQEQMIALPDSSYRFLHDCVITGYHNILYAAWYNCPEKEIADQSVIRGRYSADKGNTWSEIKCFAQDSTNKLMYVPPAFGQVNDQLYLYVSRMSGHDQVHDILIFRLNESEKTFVQVDSIPVPFIINTAVTKMQNGALIAGGRRTTQAGTLPLIPAVLISDSGSPLGPWRVVDIQKHSNNPDGTPFSYPETGLITNGSALTAIVRGEQSRPLVYHSKDYGNSWSTPSVIDFPLSGQSKITCGTLSDGRDYIIGNAEGYDRDKLIIGFRDKGEKSFAKAYLLQNGENAKLKASPEWSYPTAYESDNLLHVIYTSEKKAATLSIFPLHPNGR